MIEMKKNVYMKLFETISCKVNTSLELKMIRGYFVSALIEAKNILKNLKKAYLFRNLGIALTNQYD